MTALDFGPVVLGGNVFGWTADREATFAVLDAFVAGGGRMVDTADVYPAWAPGASGGDSEALIGEWLARSDRRDDVVIATKVGMLEGREGLAPDTLRVAVEDSLRRLGVDAVDLLYVHRDDADVPQEDVVAALDALVREGKVRELGASNFTADRLRSATLIAERSGLTPFTVAQDLWNLVERDIETALVPTLDELGLVELPYSSLASGFLTGKYRPDSSPVDSPRAGRAAAYLDDARNRELLRVIDDVAADHDTTVTAVALAWLRQQPVVGAPIASARTVDQLQALLASAEVELGAQDLEQLSAATAPAGG